MVSDSVLYDFADGVPVARDRFSVPEASLDAHVADCDDCQSFLAAMWSGELERDLVKPVMHFVELERFFVDVAKLGSGILAELVEALKRYGLGVGEDG